MIRRPPRSTLFPYTRSSDLHGPLGTVPVRRADPRRRREPDQLEGRRPLSRGPGGSRRRLSHTRRSHSSADRHLAPDTRHLMLTLAIIKPDALQARNAGKILAQLEATGFVVRAARLVKLTTTQAEAFYEVHRARPFYRPLVTFIDRKSTRLNSSHSQIS